MFADWAVLVFALLEKLLGLPGKQFW